MSTGTVSSSGDVHAHVAALHGQQVAKEVAAAATTSAAGGGVPTFDLWDMSVPAVALTWALDDWSLPSAADAVVIAEAAADALAERLTRVLCDVLGKSPAEAAVHLARLRSGLLAVTTRVEREYVALFESRRAARSRVLASISRCDVSVGPPCPTAAELQSGLRIPAPGVAMLLNMEPAAIMSAGSAIAHNIEAAEELGALLMEAYTALDVTPDTAAARLRALALGGAGAIGSVSDSERLYAELFTQVRDFRAAARVALASSNDGPSATELHAADVDNVMNTSGAKEDRAKSETNTKRQDRFGAVTCATGDDDDDDEVTAPSPAGDAAAGCAAGHR